jgi:lipopolysaccharide transport system ATP-binding protein
MYVRLAFAVAAHLEPEILVVDEVLAVGDAAFQKKCLGKMGDVAKKDGRTVLFVSHNMAAVKSLTKCAIVLSRGVLAFDGKTDSAIQAYVQMASRTGQTEAGRPWGSGTHTTIKAIRLVDPTGAPTTHYEAGQLLRADVEIETDGAAGLSLELFLTDASHSRIGMASTYQFHSQTLPQQKGSYICHLRLEPMWLASGLYAFDVATSVINVSWDHYVESATEFTVPFSNPLGHQFDFKQSCGYGALALLSSPQARFVQCAHNVNHDNGRRAAQPCGTCGE